MYNISFSFRRKRSSKDLPERLLLVRNLCQQRLLPIFPVLLVHLLADIFPALLNLLHCSPDGSRRLVVLFRVERGAAEGAVKDADEFEDDAGADFDEGGFAGVVSGGLFDDLDGEWLEINDSGLEAGICFVPTTHLVIANPNPPVQHVKRHDVIHKRLELARRPRHPKRLRKHLLEHLQVRLLFKRLVKRKQRPRSFQAVSRHPEFVHRMHVLHVEFGAGSVGRLGDPHVEVCCSADFEE